MTYSFSKAQIHALSYLLPSTLGLIGWLLPCSVIWALKSLVFSLSPFWFCASEALQLSSSTGFAVLSNTTWYEISLSWPVQKICKFSWFLLRSIDDLEDLHLTSQYLGIFMLVFLLLVFICFHCHQSLVFWNMWRLILRSNAVAGVNGLHALEKYLYSVI